MSPRSQQQGSALLIALFVLVVMFALTAAITRNIAASNDQTINEVLGTRALFAAEMGNERKLAQLFSYNGNLTNCDTLDDDPLVEEIYAGSGGVSFVGLEHCTVITVCERQQTGGISYFSIQSTGVCKASLDGNNGDFGCSADQVCVSRTVEVEAKL